MLDETKKKKGHIIKICENCKQEFWGFNNTKYCSKECRVYELKCQHCRKTFIADHKPTKYCLECSPYVHKHRSSNRTPKQEPLGYTSALIIVDWHYRKKLTIEMIAAELHRTPEEITEFIRRLVATGKYIQILCVLKQGGQAAKRDYRGYARKISKGVI